MLKTFTIKLEKARKIIRKAERGLLQARMKSINILDNNSKQLEKCRSHLASLFTIAIKGFIIKVREFRHSKIRYRQINKFNRLVVAEWIVHGTLNAQVEGLISVLPVGWLCSAYTWVVPDSVKSLGCVLSCLCYWCTLKNMCGPSEYAQPPYFYLPSVGVATTDALRNRKASAWGSSTDSPHDDELVSSKTGREVS